MALTDRAKHVKIGDVEYVCVVKPGSTRHRGMIALTVMNAARNVVARGYVKNGALCEADGHMIGAAAMELGLIPRPAPRVKTEPPKPEPFTIEVAINSPIDEARIGLMVAEALRTEAPSLVAEVTPAQRLRSCDLSTEIDPPDLGTPSADED